MNHITSRSQIAEELDKVVWVVMQIEQHIQESQRLAADPVTSTKHKERANQMKQMLDLRFRTITSQHFQQVQQQQLSETDPKLSEYLGAPPFEKPVIIQILKNYMESKYGPIRALYPSKVDSAAKIVKLFVIGLNKFELPAPSDQSSDRIYIVNYKRWKYYCVDCKRPYRLVEIFGRSLLKSLMKVIIIFQSFS